MKRPQASLKVKKFETQLDVLASVVGGVIVALLTRRR
jgi:hypothetical protein